MRFFALILLISCSSLEQRDQERTLQSKMLRALNEKTPQFAACARENKLFSSLKQDRVRVEILLHIGSAGTVDRFQIDNKTYPSPFVDCMFQVAEEIEFPKLNQRESVQLTQPFIFSK